MPALEILVEMELLARFWRLADLRVTALLVGLGDDVRETSTTVKITNARTMLSVLTKLPVMTAAAKKVTVELTARSG